MLNGIEFLGAQNLLRSHNVNPPPFCWLGGSTYYHIFKRRWGLKDSQLLEGDAGKERCDHFQGGGEGLQFLRKKSLKFEILNNKKSL